MEQVKKNVEIAKHCASMVRKKLPENKLKAYRTKLLSAVISNDYDRCSETLLQLSQYADVPLDFANNVFSDFETYKDNVYCIYTGLG